MLTSAETGEKSARHSLEMTSSSAPARGWMATATDAMARVVAPESLAVERGEQLSDDEVKAQSRASAVRPGDLILVSTPGKFYRFMRDFTGHDYDHIVAVVRNDCVLHVGPALVRLLPVARLLTPSRRPLVLRPQLDPQQCSQFVDYLESLVGKTYDVLRVYSLIGRYVQESMGGLQCSGDSTKVMKYPRFDRLGLDRHLGLQLPTRLSPGPHAWICSDALLDGLSRVSPLYKHAMHNLLDLDRRRLGAASISDFIVCRSVI